jgi:hypothetical protein
MHTFKINLMKENLYNITIKYRFPTSDVLQHIQHKESQRHTLLLGAMQHNKEREPELEKFIRKKKKRKG